MKSVLNSLQNGNCSFIFTTNPTVHKTVSPLQLISMSLFQPYLFKKLSLQSLLTLFTSILSNFLPPYFCVQPSLQSTSKLFSLPQPFSQSRLRQGTNEQGSHWHYLILFFFLKIWTGLTGLTIIDSLKLRLRKLAFCR